jgi:hypothetical protein
VTAACEAQSLALCYICGGLLKLTRIAAVKGKKAGAGRRVATHRFVLVTTMAWAFGGVHRNVVVNIASTTDKCELKCSFYRRWTS